MASPQSIPRLLELAETIKTRVTELQQALEHRSWPLPSFNEDGPLSVPDELRNTQDAIIDAAAELHDVLLEPLSLLYKKGAPYNNVALQAVARLNIPQLVPEDGQISFSSIAKSVRLPEQYIQRLLRMAITLRVFREPQPGILAHNKISKFLTQPYMIDWLQCGTDELWRTAPVTLDAIQKWPTDQEKNHTAFNIAYDTSDHFYTYLGKHLEKSSRFSNVMKAYVTAGPEYNLAFLADNYDWGSLGSATIVELGGQEGHVSMELSKRFTELKFIVQDMKSVVEQSRVNLPIEFRGRIEFMAHELFAPQTIEADVFYARWVFHNWPDADSVLLLQSLIPAMKSGSRLVVFETCMPEPGDIAFWKEADLRVTDMIMESLFKSRERSAKDWENLFTAADSRFKLKQVITPEGSALAIMDVRWES